MVTVSKIVPTMWNELSMFGPASRTKIRTRSPVPTLSGMVLVLVGDAVEDHEVRGRSDRRGLVEAGDLALRPEIPLALDEGELLVDLGQAPFGSTMTMPYMPLAMWCSAGAVPQWYIQTPA